MSFSYAVSIAPNRDGKSSVSCRDFPDLSVLAPSSSRPMEDALFVLEEMFNLYVSQRRKIPHATLPTPGDRLIHLSISTQAKILLWNAMVDANVNRAELGRRLEVSQTVASRLVDFTHRSKLEHIEKAMRLFDQRFIVALA